MSPRSVKFPLLPPLLVALLAGADTAAQRPARPVADGWQRTFDVTPADLVSTGENPYLILQPGYQLVLEGREGGKALKLVVSVLDETRVIAGIEARVVEERETENGALVEVSRNYFAMHKTTRDVYYLGEDVDVYKGGTVVNHEGTWLHGAGGATLGLMMPGSPAAGRRYYQEVAPGVAMDRAEVASVGERLTTPAGAFERCLKTAETTPLEAGTEYKIYAPGVGLIKDGSLVLVSYAKR